VTEQILAWLREVKEKYHLVPRSVLDVGSRNVNGTPRSVFTDVERYVGVDMEAGPGVDMVMNAHDLDLQEKFDLVVCCEMLEHDLAPMDTVDLMRNHLLDGGVMIITSPAQGFKIHGYPRDYWRFLPDTYEDIFFEDMEILELTEVEGPTLCCIGALNPIPPPPVV